MCDQRHPADPEVRCLHGGDEPHFHFSTRADLSDTWPLPEDLVAKIKTPPKRDRSAEQESIEKAKGAAAGVPAEDRGTSIQQDMDRIKRQKDLDRPSAAIHHNAPDTSLAAADRVLPRTGTLRRRVYDAFVAAGDAGMTEEEAEEATKLRPNTLRPRRWELVNAGWLVDSGRIRLNQQGNDSIVWVVASAANEAMPLRDFG